jgi:hypothetical protein
MNLAGYKRNIISTASNFTHKLKVKPKAKIGETLFSQCQIRKNSFVRCK